MTKRSVEVPPEVSAGESGTGEVWPKAITEAKSGKAATQLIDFTAQIYG
jgi:hypothetical protein